MTYWYVNSNVYINMRYLTTSHLLTALKGAGLPCTRTTLINYERLGIVRRPKTVMAYRDREDRVYDEKEIDRIVKQVKKYVESKKKS